MKTWFHGDGRYLNRIPLPNMCPPDDPGGGGGDDKDKGKKADSVSKAEFDELKTKHSSLMEKFDKLMKSRSKDRDDDEDDQDDDDKDEDLLKRSKKARADADKNKNDSKALEAALRFNMGAQDWLKNNEPLLPKGIADIFTQAEKEKYESAIEKDAAIKSGIIQSFFEVQANLDLLTPSLKSTLEDYLKLTKNGKQEKAREIYDTIFEPSFEMLRRVKKAEALSKGHGSGDDDTYKKKLMGGSRKHYLGEKTDA